MRLVFEPNGDVHGERVSRAAANDQLTSSALVNDVIDTRIHEIIAERANNPSGPTPDDG